jgi:SOS-response transcriptional repressor LexA
MAGAEDRLRQALRTRGLTPFVGAGLSLAATDNAKCAGWRGLLESGIEACESAIPKLGNGWGDRERQKLRDGDLDDFLDIGDGISRRLKGTGTGRDFDSWIQGAVGALSLTDDGRQLIHEVRELGKVIATTNYDSLIENIDPRWPSYTWEDEGFAGALQESGVVLHLHGSVTSPRSVILGSADYQRRDSPLNQVLSRSLFVSHTLTFIGCGDGLGDPHIAPIFRFMQASLEGARVEHFILVTSEEQGQLAAHPLSRWVTPVAYGTGYPDLLPYLQRLNASRGTAAAVKPSVGPQSAAGGVAAAQHGAGPLFAAVEAQQKLRNAFAGLDGVRAQLREVESDRAVSPDIGAWEIPEQADEHVRLAEQLKLPTERLAARCEQALPLVRDAVDSTWPLALPQARRSDSLEQISEDVGQLEQQSRQLTDRLARARGDLLDRAEHVGTAYEEPGRNLTRAHDALGKALALAVSLREGMDRQQAGQETGRQRAMPPVTSVPDLQPSASDTSAASSTGPRLAPVLGQARGGVLTGIGQPSDEQIPVPPEYELKGEVYALKVVGDSMTADGVLDGDYLTVLRTKECEDGDMVIAGFGGQGDDSAVVKWLRRPAGSSPYLESPDSADTEELRKAGPFEVRGKVIGVVRWKIKRLSQINT